VFPAKYELNSYIVFRKRLVSKRLRVLEASICVMKVLLRGMMSWLHTVWCAVLTLWSVPCVVMSYSIVLKHRVGLWWN
jgi:hypothetical protein